MSPKTDDFAQTLAPSAPPLPHKANHPTTTDALAEPPRPMTLDLSPRLFRLAWVAVFVLHGGLGAFFGVLAALYAYIETILFYHFVENYGVSTLVSHFRAITALYGVFAAAHGLQIVKMLAFSLLARQLTLTRLKAAKIRPKGGPDAAALVMSGRRSSNRWQRVRTTIVNALDPETDAYSALLCVQETLEILSQSYQTYRMSYLLPRPWINNLFLTCMVVNAFSTPCFHWKFAKRLAHERAWSLVFDTVLGLVMVVVVPFVVAKPYVQAYSPAEMGFTESTYQEKWFVRAVNEIKMVMINSRIDFASRIVPTVSMLVGLSTLQDMLRPAKTPDVSRSRSRNATTPHASPPFVETHVSPPPSRATRFVRKMQACFLAWGLAMIVIHFYASTRPTPMACDLPVQPWFATRGGCALVTVNCYTLGLTGEEPEVFAILNSIDDRTLAYIAVKHCPHFEMPPRLQKFSVLIGIKFYNSTIVRWDTSAALLQTNQERIALLYLVRTNATEFPLGLVQSPFPSTLVDIALCVTNITTLPDAAADAWQHLSTFTFEASGVIELPPVISQLNLDTLSLAANAIPAIPDDAFATQRFSSLVLSGNPIAHLPNTLGDTSGLQFFIMDSTDLQDLPSWLDAAWTETVYMTAGGTPVCEAYDNGDYVGYVIDCFPYTDMVFYPLETDDDMS